MGFQRSCRGLLVGASLLVSAVACTGLQHQEEIGDINFQYQSVEPDGGLLTEFAPIFLIEEFDKSYNRIGTPALRDVGNGTSEAFVDSRQPSIYAMEQEFRTEDRVYTNLIYRVHFEKTPYSHLTGGKNVGLLVIVTLNQQEKPVLLTTLHTCGCYLAFVPTSNLPESVYPENWDVRNQMVFGERLPGVVDFKQTDSETNKLVYRLRTGTHRVMGIDVLKESTTAQADIATVPLIEMSALRKLPFGDSEESFFETEGPRKGYVRNSHKPLERLFMSWWALDWRIGEDKDLGPSEDTGTVFYTSLKPWARKKSDLWKFSEFLEYWGWRL